MSSSTSSQTSPSPPFQDRAERRWQELQQEHARLEQEMLQMRAAKYFSNYEIEIVFPAVISPSSSSSSRSTTTGTPSKPLRTNDEILQHRLMEAGILYDIPMKVSDVIQASNEFIANLEQSGCFNAVRVEIGAPPVPESVAQEPTTTDRKALRSLKVELEEAKWYRLYAGGGIKSESILQPERLASESGVLNMAEAEISLGLRNLAGCLDTTTLQFTLDAKSLANWSLVHQRPLYTVVPGIFKELLLTQPHGSQYTLHAKAVIDTTDLERTRSYKEFQRLISLKATNTPMASREQQAGSKFYYTAFEWMTVLRDIVPRRHMILPFAFDASPAIVSQSGPSVKNSFLAEFRTNGSHLTKTVLGHDGEQMYEGLTQHPLQPTSGLQAHAEVELATPPGDVGFFKCQSGASLHLPIIQDSINNHMAMHLSLNAGYLHSLSFGGLCRPATISDRFFIGGPMQLRGFSPAGIGPRAYPQQAATKASAGERIAGDALGGDFYYTATAMASLSPTLFPQLHAMVGDQVASAVRFFCFVNAGTCVGTIRSTPVWAVLQSTRVSLGVGLSTTVAGPRLEVTYATPLRYGPRDMRRQFQFGIGFSIS